MPIYIESKGIVVNGNIAARHEYLVYVPIGQELNYSMWTSIGAYPKDKLIRSGPLLNAEFIESPMNLANEDRWQEAGFLFGSGTVEQRVAAGLGADAASVGWVKPTSFH